MGKLTTPSVPVQIADSSGGRPNACPECEHDELFAAPEWSLARRILGLKPKPYTCAHIEVEQDALVDDYVRCSCSTSWHIA